MSAPTLLLHGPLTQLSSFSLVNRHLANALSAHGWSVSALASDGPTGSADSPLPDVYLFHGHPYDLVNAPGRTNAYFLSYDYQRFVADDRVLVGHLNRLFDIVVTPSRFSRDACIRSGVAIPVAVCPYGVDRTEFHPEVAPVSLADRRGVCLLALGGANERKGTDIVLDAYVREFTDQDDVTLVIKAFGYRHLRDWTEALIAEAGRRANAPHIVYDRDEPASVAGYYTAVDAGVFPFRAEGFGLPILECLASGRPVIATRAGGPRDYARRGVSWIDTRTGRVDGKWQYAPDRRHLQRLMRAAVERGPLDAARAGSIADATAAWSWQRTGARLDRILRRAATRRRATAPTPATRAPALRSTTYVFHEHGTTSWRAHSAQISDALRQRPGRHLDIPRRRLSTPTASRMLVAQSDFALEAFRRAAPETHRVLHRESGPLASIAAIVDRERARCDAPPAPISGMALWRDHHEAQLAARIVVASGLSRQLYVQQGHDVSKIRVLWPGIAPARPSRRRAAGVTRLLFVASNPFRKGIRVLFDAWRLLPGQHAELWCVCPPEVYASQFVLRHLTADARIHMLPFRDHRAFMALYREVDAVVLPSFEEGFPYVIADALARALPTIVSTTSGIDEALTHDRDALVVKSGQVTPLAEAIERVLSDARLRRRLGDAARETARTITWKRFGEGWHQILDELERR